MVHCGAQKQLDTPAIIMHDNTMKMIGSVSEQLKRRRLELGLSLSEVARRASTSSATLSRYEHGWTRFETYTLRKLAVSLGCDLQIEFCPKPHPEPRGVDISEALDVLGRLFWDHKLKAEDLEVHPVWVVERVLEYGKLNDVRLLRQVMGKQAFLLTVADAERVSPRTRNFWAQILELEGRPCTKAYSRHTAWNS